MGYDQTSESSLDSDVDSYEEIEKMYDNIERRKRKIERMKDEIAKNYKSKKVFVFNVYNVSDKEDFNQKMQKDFDYLVYNITEEDKEEDCLVVEVERTMAEDFLNIEGCQIKNANISIYLDEDCKKKGKGKGTSKPGPWNEPPKTGTWNDPPKTGTWDDPPKKPKPTEPKPEAQKKGRKRLIKN